MTRWTPEQKAEALRLYGTKGATVAAKETGVPRSTVIYWVAESGQPTHRPEQTRKAIEATKLRWEQRRESLVHEIGKVAEKALDRVQDSLEEQKARDAQSYATTLAILVDKAQLLSGGATSRPNVDPSALLGEGKARVIGLVPQRKAG